MSTPQPDEGAAAVEMALVTGLLLTLVAGFVAPLGVIYYESVQLGRTANDVVRFASSRPAVTRYVEDPAGGAPSIVRAGDLPTTAQIQQEAQRTTGTRAGLATTVTRLRPSADVPADPTCASGRRVTVQIRNVVDLDVFTAFIPLSTKTLSATATSCEE
jgi:Flp pilus assembly protein TadG